MSFGMIILNQSINTMQNYFISHIKTEDVYEDIANYIGKRLDTSNYR